MPKKSAKDLSCGVDFTLNDCANSTKPVNRIKKTTTETDLTWDQLDDDSYDIIEEIAEDGTRNIVKKKKPQIIEEHGNIYPEILWYLISLHIKPEDVGRFASINRACYSISRKAAFWRMLYNKYCRNHPKLPLSLRLENSYTTYGLRPLVIRGLMHTSEELLQILMRRREANSHPSKLVRSKLIDMSFSKHPDNWMYSYKFKKYAFTNNRTCKNLIDELGRFDANPDEDCQILQVICRVSTIMCIPEAIGMSLNCATMKLNPELSCYRLYLGFDSSRHVTKNVRPDFYFNIDSVIKVCVLDWWDPRFPYTGTRLRKKFEDEDAIMKDFFDFSLNDEV